ncbi:serine/threonine-protein kinase [Kitasatospora sp. NPDC048365]|uniref:serine/threonine-protein kinase n=1 Tax=Kitasatospora sp. NPDC048365 TaxID=3364050 RepID=UPI003714E588
MHAHRSAAAPAPTFRPLEADDPVEVGGYRLVARLGAGGMGRVYLAHTPGGRPVALKVVRPELAEDPEFRLRFAHEVASARLIHGLYTAQVVDAGPEDPTPWLATAYVPGPSLHQVVHDNGPLPEQTVLLLTAGIAEALQAIHAVGVVHRDLKPANVLLAADGPRVIDFGIARAADAVALTGAGLRIGSPGYMAPEQALGRTATPATDVFALGALAAYVAGGTPPFGRGPESGALYRVVHEEPDLDAVPPVLAGLVRHCLAKHPEDRPTTAQLIGAVHHALGGQPSFTDGWLPQQVRTEINRRTDLPRSPSEARTLLVPPPTLHGAPTAAAPAPAPAPVDPPASRRRTGRRTAVTAAVAALALLAGIGGTASYLLTNGDEDGYEATPEPSTAVPTPSAALPSPSPSPTALPSTAAGYTLVYGGRELVSPDHSYEFDLKTGTVVAEETASWFVSRTASEFVIADANDAFTAETARLGAADCLKGLDSRPAARLDFTGLAGRSFCVRSQDGRDLALVRLLSAAAGDGPVRISVDYYRRGTD